MAIQKLLPKQAPKRKILLGTYKDWMDKLIGEKKELMVSLSANKEIYDLRLHDGSTIGGHVLWTNPKFGGSSSASGSGSFQLSNPPIIVDTVDPSSLSGIAVDTLWLNSVTYELFKSTQYNWESLGSLKASGPTISEIKDLISLETQGLATDKYVEDVNDNLLTAIEEASNVIYAPAPPPSDLTDISENTIYVDTIEGSIWQLLVDYSPLFLDIISNPVYNSYDTVEASNINTLVNGSGSGSGAFWHYLGTTKNTLIGSAANGYLGDYYFQKSSSRLYKKIYPQNSGEISDFDFSDGDYAWSEVADLGSQKFFSQKDSSAPKASVAYIGNERKFYIKTESIGSSAGTIAGKNVYNPSYSWDTLEEIVASEFKVGSGPPPLPDRPYDVYYDKLTGDLYRAGSSGSSYLKQATISGGSKWIVKSASEVFNPVAEWDNFEINFLKKPKFDYNLSAYKFLAGEEASLLFTAVLPSNYNSGQDIYVFLSPFDLDDSSISLTKLAWGNSSSSMPSAASVALTKNNAPLTIGLPDSVRFKLNGDNSKFPGSFLSFELHCDGSNSSDLYFTGIIMTWG